ncbi:FecR family protein [Chitinimonas taiwanensis]|uniref:FecR family protein n=1 Tax=Chitinimonas taiwanensis TaxID=240412 RepID=UPI0035B1226E
MLVRLAHALLALGLCVNALAAANVTTARGQVNVTLPDGSSRLLESGARVESGSKIVTGANGFALLRFDDGQLIALEKDTDFSIEQYRYNRAEPGAGSAFFSMLRGSLRAITGLIGQSNKAAFRLNTPTATIGIRGSDWMAALLQNNLYTGVNSGGIGISNAAGSLGLSAGQYSATLGTNASQLVSFSQLPAGVFGSLPQLSLGGLTAGSASSGASAASGGGIAGVSTGAIAAGVGLAGAIAITSSTDDTPSSHTTPSHHGVK